MSDTDQSVQVTVLIPKDVYRQVTETAAGEQRQIEDFLGLLIAEGLASHVTVRQIMETVSAQYRDRLKLSKISLPVLPSRTSSPEPPRIMTLPSLSK